MTLTASEQGGGCVCSMYVCVYVCMCVHVYVSVCHHCNFEKGRDLITLLKNCLLVHLLINPELTMLCHSSIIPMVSESFLLAYTYIVN